MNRREFIGGTALAGSALAIAQDTAPDPGWFDRPMRWAQLTLVEDDPGKYDLPFWLDYFRRTHSDAACLSAGGCVAYYPTKIPLHYRSAWLKDGDAFGDLVGGCRKLGMNVIARTDPHAVHQDVSDAHPDWIAVDAEGKKRRRCPLRVGHVEGGGVGAHPLCRSPGAQRPCGAVGEWEKRQGVSRGHGAQTHRRHLQRGRRGAVPLEGLGAERRRSAAVGAR